MKSVEKIAYLEKLLEQKVRDNRLLKQEADHLPFYRQEQIFKRQAIDISRKRMCDWHIYAADWLQPIQDGVKNSKYMQVDETPARYIEPGSQWILMGI
jgi:transposase